MSIEKAIKNAAASVKIEGFQIDTNCIDMCKKLLRNEISLDQYINHVKQKSGINTQ